MMLGLGMIMNPVPNHKKRNKKYIVIVSFIVLILLINWCCQSLWNLGILFCMKEIDSFTVPNIKYHQHCHSIFTLQKTLDSLSCKAGSSSG